jgi:hypothetical protein
VDRPLESRWTICATALVCAVTASAIPAQYKREGFDLFHDMMKRICPTWLHQALRGPRASAASGKPTSLKRSNSGLGEERKAHPPQHRHQRKQRQQLGGSQWRRRKQKTVRRDQLRSAATSLPLQLGQNTRSATQRHRHQHDLSRLRTVMAHAVSWR